MRSISPTGASNKHAGPKGPARWPDYSHDGPKVKPLSIQYEDESISKLQELTD